LLEAFLDEKDEELTCDKNEHASVTNVRVFGPHAHEIPNTDRRTARNNENTSLPELVGIVDLDAKGDGAQYVYWDSHVVDLERSKAARISTRGYDVLEPRLTQDHR
jgi:hypothetical protein